MTDSTFSLILLLLVVFSGLVTLIDIFWLSKKSNHSYGKNSYSVKNDQEKTGWVATIRSIFPVLLIVLLIRSFLFSPFKIPSGSMLPTLKIGDYILVNKFDYGLRFPYFGNKFLSIGQPQRGDVVVFNSTSEFSAQNNGKKEDLIKRLVGLPGDHIHYQGKNLYINGKLVSKTFVSTEEGDFDPALNGAYPYKIFQESLGKHKFQVQNYPAVNARSGSWTVPPNMYFMMGDNRDLSDDSRYWGFVPASHIIGKAVFVWMHWPSWGQLPSIENDRIIH